MKKNFLGKFMAVIVAVIMAFSFSACNTPASSTPETKTYTLTFDMSGVGEQIASQTLKENVQPSIPAKPSAEGYVFDGWYTDANYSLQYNFYNVLTSDVTVYAKWIKDEETYPANGERKIIDVQKTVYLTTAASADVISVAYYEGQEEILMVELNKGIEEILKSFVLAMVQGSVTVEEDETQMLLTREDGTFCLLDFVKDTIHFSDFDSFVKKGFGANPHDLLAYPYANEEGEAMYLKRGKSFYTPSYSLLIDLAARNIPLDIYNGKKYMPLQTFNDLFVAPFGANIAYNGKDVFVFIGNNVSADLERIYYHSEPTQMSEALMEYNFNELCLYLDLYYGLKSEHGFNDGFAYYFESIGMKEKFFTGNAMDIFNAIGNLTFGYIADAHSQILSPSPYNGSSQPTNPDITAASGFISYVETSQAYSAIRQQVWGDYKYYEKVGNTAYVTIDSFTLGDRSIDYSTDEGKIASLQVGDTLSIIMAAHAQIAADDEIENVVLDLSCNGGGAVDSAVYTVAWMLGSCDLSIQNTITQSKSTITYYADVNMDGVFDEEDSIADKNLYCIISPVSFSCGNYVPALLKTSGKVTIVGKSSSGGACTVNNAMSADGTAFNISGPDRMSIVQNGSYYSVDQGVQPDVYLTNMENFFDRVCLTAYLNANSSL